jgi:transcriptional regulator with XRE-family HTH domain
MTKDDRASSIGDKIREVREKRGITLRALAEEASVSESLVSQIERGKVSPSLDTLMAIVGALDIDLEWLFKDYKRRKAATVTRKAERRVTSTPGIEYQQVSVLRGGSAEHAAEVRWLTMDPGAKTGDTEYGHVGSETGVILKGRAQLAYGAKTYELEEGDAASFSSDIPHTLANAGKGRLVALWITTPPRR